MKKSILNLYWNLKVHCSPLPLCLFFNTSLLPVEVGIRFKVLRIKSNTKYCVMELIQ